MHVNEYGSPGDPVVILLAPMMVSGSDLYELMSPHFKGAYYFVAPDQGGHGKAGNYKSADEEYRQLKAWLSDKGIHTVAIVYAASLGVALGWRLFMDPAFEVHRAWFDGVALSKNARFAEWFMKRLFRARKKSLAKTRVEASPNLVNMYGYEFAKMMTKNFERITIQDIDKICHACCHYDLRRLTEEEQSKLHLDFGEKDFDLKYSRKTIPVYMPKAELVIRPGYAHCGYMAAETKTYVEQIEAFLEQKEKK